MGCTLVIDTSFGSTVGIVGREPIVETDSRTHVEKLQVNIARAVEEAGLTPADIEEIVVGIGPAPFRPARRHRGRQGVGLRHRGQARRTERTRPARRDDELRAG